MASPAWLDELAFPAEGPPWLAMGLSRCDEARWLLPDERRDDELAQRRHALDERHAEVFAALPGTEPAGDETLALVEGWLAEHHVEPSGPGPGGDMHPLELAGRQVQEDLCLMVERDGGYHLDAACLCFPSHWRLADKLGRSAAAIHGPVPGYDVELGEKVDRYLARLRPGAIGVRRNWSIHDSPELFAPERPASGRVEPESAMRLWLRSERQTLRRLPRSGAILFTIRVQQVQLGQLADRPDVAARFAARLGAQPDALTAMNGLERHRDDVIHGLESMVGGRG